MSHVFVSYCKDDVDDVQILVEALRAEGRQVWWDNDITPGEGWERQIQEALSSAHAVIVAWTPLSVDRSTVAAEARAAQGAGKLIQVILKASTPPLFFREQQWIDLSKWRGAREDASFQKLLLATDPTQDIAAFSALPTAAIPFHRRFLRSLRYTSVLVTLAIAAFFVWQMMAYDAVSTEQIIGLAIVCAVAAVLASTLVAFGLTLIGKRR